MISNYFTNIKISSMILITGILGDEITTFTGLSTGKCVEINPFTRNLIKTGIWSLFDILLIVICLSLSYIVANKNNNKLSRIISFIPTISGIVRIIAFISNLFLLLSL
jgi:hypothetical protein